MEINLAGYNVEAELLEQLSRGQEATGPLTPETFSAAYARISRSSDDVATLRRLARKDVDKARKSNKTIIFKMGHHSVAEHAVFNFDVIGVSRLAMEELEKFRLVSFTEKSQRYVTLDGDYALPAEITDNDAIQLFKETVELQNAFYNKAFSALTEYLFAKYPDRAAQKQEKNLLEGQAKEDARYILSMATEGQVGLTINARNLEHLFRRFALSRREEVREMGRRMFDLVQKVAPSLFLFPEPSKFESAFEGEGARGHWLNGLSNTKSTGKNTGDNDQEPVILLHTENADEKILAAFSAFLDGVDYEDLYNGLLRMDAAQKADIFKSLFSEMEFFDSPPREFELPDVTFRAVVSASNFAQLKRHRMATLLAGDYRTGLGNVIPESIKTVGLEDEFNAIIAATNRAYDQLKARYGAAADYILTNSHCRTVVVKMNLRELYHFVRLRSDQHAQWDIRRLSDRLMEKIKAAMPLSSMLLCGKSQFVRHFENIYGKKPGFLI